MARRRKLTEEKKNAIAGFIEMYDIKGTGDLQEAIKDVMGDTIQEMLEADLDEELGYERYEKTEDSKTNYRNGHKPKNLKSTMGESGMKEAVAAAFPMTELQRCIVHMVRNTLLHVSDKYKKEFANDLKTIYHAPNEETGLKNMRSVKEKWEKVYPNSMKRWSENRDRKIPARDGSTRVFRVAKNHDGTLFALFFKFSTTVRKVLYTTNAIESLNSQYRRINSARSVFPSEDALKKALFLSTQLITKKWTTKIRNWGQIYGELSILYDGRI